jgi:hypothetical protein
MVDERLGYMVVGADTVGKRARHVFGFLEEGINYTLLLFIIN